MKPDLTLQPTNAVVIRANAWELHQAGDLDRQRASFDKLRMRFFLRATKVTPHPELVEGRTVALQRV
jgi:hypothetical protein